MFLAQFFSRQFAVYLLFGGSAALVNLVCGYLLYTYTSIPYFMAVFCAGLCGLMVNFLLNYFFNFVYRKRSMFSQLLTFTLVALFGILLTTLLAEIFLYIFVLLDIQFSRYFLTPKFLSLFLATGLVTIYSFLVHKFFTFNKGILAQCKDFLTKRARQRG